MRPHGHTVEVVPTVRPHGHTVEVVSTVRPDVVVLLLDPPQDGAMGDQLF